MTRPNLTPERWKQIDRLFEAALDRPIDQRHAFLAEACGPDTTLREEVWRLLGCDEEARKILGESAADYAGPLIEARISILETSEIYEEDWIEPYHILRQIGRGGMGEVYLAERADGQFEREVAIKVVRRGMDTDDILRRFHHERQILARLRHPNIARLYDGGTTRDRRPYLVMEYVDGQPMTRYCDDRKMRVDERLGLFLKACQAVQYAHQNLVVHRDLKPSNVLVSPEGDVKLLDFGIAKLLENDSSDDSILTTKTGHRILTPEYASPEQLRNEPATTATDVYALGVMLYELLTGRRPFDHKRHVPYERPIEEKLELPSTIVTKPITKKLQNGTLETISADEVSGTRGASKDRLSRRLRGDLDTILLKALKHEPSRRYLSVDQFMDDIRRHLEGQPIAARRDSIVYRVNKFVRRNKILVAASAAFLILLAGYAVTVTTQSRVIATERDKSLEVTAFLRDIFEGSDPYADPSDRIDTLRIRDFLDRGTNKVRSELASQPLIQAQMLDILGDVNRKLGRYREAESLAGQALSIRKNHGSAKPEELAESLYNLGYVLFETDRLDAADSLLHEALDLQKRQFGSVHAAVAQTQNALGNLRQKQGRFDESEALYKEALSQRSKLLGPTHRKTIATMNNLAEVLVQKANYAEAEPLFRKVLDINRQLLGPDHPHVATSMNGLAYLLVDVGRLDEAEELQREVLSIRRNHFDSPHPDLARAVNNLAALLAQKEEYDEAETLYHESLTLRRVIYGENHAAVAIGLNNLAMLAGSRKEFGKAEDLSREALAKFILLLGEDHPSVAVARSNLARVLRDRDKLEEAIDQLRVALSIRRGKLTEDHPSTARTMSELGEMLHEAGEYEEAESLLVESFDIFDKLQDTQQEQWELTRERLVHLFETMGQADRAKAYQ